MGTPARKSLLFAVITSMIASVSLSAQFTENDPNWWPRIDSPRGEGTVMFFRQDTLYFGIEHHTDLVLDYSRLGIRTDKNDFTDIRIVSIDTCLVSGRCAFRDRWTCDRDHMATKAVCKFMNKSDEVMEMEFRVGGNYVAFRYILPEGGARILEELTEFSFLESVDCDHIEKYAEPAAGDGGLECPALFKLWEDEENGDAMWVLIGEYGDDENYPALCLGNHYRIQRWECPGGITGVYQMLESGTEVPVSGVTPWRAVVFGYSLEEVKNIVDVETGGFITRIVGRQD